MGTRPGAKLTVSHKKAISEGIQKSATRAADKMRGRPQNIDTVVGAHENNLHAKIWCLLSPDNVEYRFKNLNQFLRDNPHLFDKEDLNWVRSGCNAARGLRSLFHLKKDGSLKNYFWRGWKIGDRQDP